VVLAGISYGSQVSLDPGKVTISGKTPTCFLCLGREPQAGPKKLIGPELVLGNQRQTLLLDPCCRIAFWFGPKWLSIGTSALWAQVAPVVPHSWGLEPVLTGREPAFSGLTGGLCLGE
jgi:hypothetical protein